MEKHKFFYTTVLSLGAIAGLVLLSAIGKIGDPSGMIVAIGMGGFNTAIETRKKLKETADAERK